MLVRSFRDPEHRRPTVDIFSGYPMDFEFLLTGTRVRVASLEHLIALKRAAGRPRDLEDVDRLLEISRQGER